jgi:hypothetical protein
MRKTLTSGGQIIKPRRSTGAKGLQNERLEAFDLPAQGE